jgi:hypothetical protein
VHVGTVAVLQVKLTGDWARRFGDADIVRLFTYTACEDGVLRADPAARTKGHIAPLYQTMPAKDRFALLNSQWLPRPRAYRHQLVMAADICPEKAWQVDCPWLVFSDADIKARHIGGAQLVGEMGRPLALKRCLRSLDISRLDKLSIACCAGLAQVRG